MSSSVAFRVSTPTQSPALFAPSSISTSTTTTTAFDGIGMRDQRFASSHDLTLLATDSKEQKSAQVESHLPPRCKIICTIGPSSKSPDKLKQLMLAGMNVARLNFSHGDHKYHLETITNIREVTNETRRICAILLDTKGPEIRTGRMIDDKEVLLTKGSEFVLTTDESVLGDKDHVAVFYSNLPKVLKVGDHVLIDDGLIDLIVLEIGEGTVKTRVINNGMLGSTKGVNLPGVIVDLPAVTQKDVADITFGIDQGIDFIAASFVRKRDDVLTIRKILESRGTKGTGIKIISKIENQEGLDNFDSILQVSDGIMVARGDLGVEIPIEQVAIAQKMMIRKCNAAGKFVVTATQMLESMTKNPSPTRAEATDVANAVLDGTDCVMLSGETAKGAYPVEAVRMMADICREAEASTNYRATSQMLRDQIRGTVSVVEAIASAAVRASFDLGASLLIVLTETGATARLVSKYRPRAPILTITSSEQCARQALVSRGLFPLLVGSMVGSDSLINRVIGAAQRLGMCQVGDLVVVTSGSREGTAGTTNDLKVVQVSFPFSNQTHH